MEAEELLKRFALVKRYTEGDRDFTGINLNEANLSRINLSQSILRGASLFVTNISGANLSEVNLSEANLNVARLSSTNLSRAILNGATLNVANLVRADLSAAQLIGASLIRSELVRCELSKANFSGANLTEADLREVKLTQANLCGANLSGSNLRGASAASANFQAANLHGADLTKAELSGVNFSKADLRQACLQQVDLCGADLSGANLKWADLTGANLNGADLRNTNLANASLVHADLTETNLINADWVGADLRGATLTGAKVYLVPRFGIIADDITCQWVDISPVGDGTQIQKFKSSSEARKFLNHTPGLVRIVVDAILDHSSNSALATAYSEIAQHYPALSSPPNIEVGYRRTTLTFRFDSDEHLLPAAFLVILPFKDAVPTQKNIMAVSKNIESQDLEKKRRVQLAKALNTAMDNLNELKKNLQSALNDYRQTKFFHSPTQTILISSGQEILTVQSHPNFGQRGGNNHQSKFSLPVGQKVVDFMASFDYVD